MFEAKQQDPRVMNVSKILIKHIAVWELISYFRIVTIKIDLYLQYPKGELAKEIQEIQEIQEDSA